MNLIIPAAGLGLRFIEAGYSVPKPFIDLAGRPLVDWVLQHGPQGGDRVLITQSGFACTLAKQMLKNNNLQIVGLDLPQWAAGTTKTVLEAKDYLRWDVDVLVLNSDNIIQPVEGWDNWRASIPSYCAGAIVTFEANGNQYSYVGGQHGVADRVVEKAQISTNACAGAFWFRSFALLYAACTEHLAGKPDFHGEYYLAPVYNHLIENGCRVDYTPLKAGSVFIRVNVPEDVSSATEELKNRETA